jgi:hypothetical protein
MRASSRVCQLIAVCVLAATPLPASAQAAHSGAGKSDTPGFHDYAVKKQFKARPVPVSLKSPEARMFRTRLREGARTGPNFAGHYTIVTWGCGTSCTNTAIVDALTGQVFFPPQLNPFTYPVGYGLGDSLGIEYKPDSLLIVATGASDEDGRAGVYYYVWRNRKLEIVRMDEAKPTEEAEPAP